MKTQNVELTIKVEDTSLLPGIEKALDELDIILEADYSGLTEDYREQMGKGIAEISFFPRGVVAENVEGRVVSIELGIRNGIVPGVSARGLESLCHSYELSYWNGRLQIVRRSDSPIRYAIH